MEKKTISVPDLGGANQVEVIEILVKPGDDVKIDTPLITLESDKASMEIPSSAEGKVENILIKMGDKLSKGDAILVLVSTQPTSAEEKEPPKEEQILQNTASLEKAHVIEEATAMQSSEVSVPDIGGSTQVEVIEILVKIGDFIEKDQSLITLESDKASMDIPAPSSGTITKIHVKLGDKVSQGTPILDLKNSNITQDKQPDKEAKIQQIAQSIPVKAEPISTERLPLTEAIMVMAGPAVRRMARELGVDLAQLSGSGRKSRITTDDIRAYVKKRLSEKNQLGVLNTASAPEIDFTQFGSIAINPLNKIKRLTAAHVHRSWITIPHVTQFDEADITELENFRKSEQLRHETAKLTLLAFVTKVVYKALVAFPQFNTSLDAKGENLIFKNYFNIGIAVETPQGLVVPVIKQIEQLTILEIAEEMAKLSKKARDKGLAPADMSGGCFTISSLGGIGGTAFTPIVNSPEAAILGLSRASIKPVFSENAFKPRLILPLSLSYDHRIIDGAEAARFTRYIAELLGDIRRILL